IITSLGLPRVIMVVLTFVALADAAKPAVHATGLIGLGAVCVWYLLILGLSLTRNSELPERFWQGARSKYSLTEISAAKSVSPILFVFALVPIFWALFDQTNSTWVLQGNQMKPLALPSFYFPAIPSMSALLHGTASWHLNLIQPVIDAEKMQS